MVRHNFGSAFTITLSSRARNIGQDCFFVACAQHLVAVTTEEIEAMKTWAEWLAKELAERGWRQADLVRESRGAIKPDRVSKWLAGKEMPSFNSALITADALGVPQSKALQVAGFDGKSILKSPEAIGTLAELANAKRQVQVLTVRLDALRSLRLSEFSDAELAEEILRRAEERDVSGGQEHMSDEELKERYDLAAHHGDDEAPDLDLRTP